MKVSELIQLLSAYPNDAEVRLGEQIEAGPYLNQRVGSIFTNPPGPDGEVVRVVLCADDDDLWKDELAGEDWPVGISEMPCIWTHPT